MKKTINKKENFTSIHNKLINDSRISLKAKGIMLYMLSKPENWKYYPKEIAKNSKDGLDSVYSGIKELIEAGYISRTRHSDGTIDYFVFEDVEENDIIDFSKKENPNRENPNREIPNRENPNREIPDVLIRKNTNKERIIVNNELKKEKTEIHFTSIYQSEEFKQTFSDFLEMRKTIKKPATKKAIEMIMIKLEKLNNEEKAIKMLERSIINNWQDVYEIQERSTNASKNYSTTNKGTREVIKRDYYAGTEDWNK